MLSLMLNLVARAPGHAMLVRAADVTSGLDTVLARRRVRLESPTLVAGPGKIGQALKLDLSFNHHDVCARGGLELHRATTAVDILTGPRVGPAEACDNFPSARG